MRLPRPRLIAAFSVALLALAGSLAGQGSPPAAPLTLLTRDGRRPLPTTVVDDAEMIALDDLAATFGATVREDTLAGAVTVSYKGRTIVLTPDQPLASVGGRLVSLPAAPVRSGRRWLVPVEFIGRALALIYDSRLDLRKSSRLLIAGDLTVPRLAARHEVIGNQARITLDVVPATPHSIVQEIDRILVRFQVDALDATISAAPSPDIVRSLRVADTGTALAIELGPRFASFRSTSAPFESGGTRITVDVLSAESETAPAQPAPPDVPPLVGLAPASAIRTIVIDPGHGGDENGARGPSGALEKDVTLSVARRLKGAIEARLGIRVLLTREDDRTVGLDERAAIANNNKADLFLSLHTNAALRDSVGGAEVSYLSLDRYGDEARRIAATEGPSLPAIGGGAREIEVVLWELAQVRHIEQSAALADLLEDELRARVDMGPRPVQQAPFRVLVGANMPAVLVEMGYLSNPEQEHLLASGAFQGSIVQALYDAVLRFLDYLQRPVGERPAAREAPRVPAPARSPRPQ